MLCALVWRLRPGLRFPSSQVRLPALRLMTTEVCLRFVSLSAFQFGIFLFVYISSGENSSDTVSGWAEALHGLYVDIGGNSSVIVSVVIFPTSCLFLVYAKVGYDTP
jgi:hypothetical protein